MAIAKFLYGTKERLNAKDIENGAFYITTDEGKLYLDLEDKRLPLTPIITVDEAALAVSPRTVIAQDEMPTNENCLIWIRTNHIPDGSFGSETVGQPENSGNGSTIDPNDKVTLPYEPGPTTSS